MRRTAARSPAKSWAPALLPPDEQSELLSALANVAGTGRCPPAEAQELWMTWDMVREMQRDGMHFGGHTVNHPCVSRISAEAQRFELRECRARIEKETGRSPKLFSYPYGVPGAFNAETESQLQAAGYQWGFTLGGGYSAWETVSSSPFRVTRVAVETTFTPALFLALLATPQIFCRPSPPPPSRN